MTQCTAINLLTLNNEISIPPANVIFFHVMMIACLGMNVSAPTTPSRMSHITRSLISTPNLSVLVCKSRSILLGSMKPKIKNWLVMKNYINTAAASSQCWVYAMWNIWEWERRKENKDEKKKKLMTKTIIEKSVVDTNIDSEWKAAVYFFLYRKFTQQPKVCRA